MQTLHKTLFSLAALSALTIATVGAQTPPASPSANPSPSATASATPAPSPSATAAPTAAPESHAHPAHANNGHHYGQFKRLLSATLPMSQVHYAITHVRQEADRLKTMHTIPFNKLRIVRMTGLHTSQAESLQFVAQTTLPSSNGSNSPIQYLQNVLANINISNALNNTLNNSNVNVVVPLTDVLNNDNISIGQVVGVYVNSAGFVYTIAG